MPIVEGVKRRGTVRFVLALLASLAAYQYGFVRALNAGGRVLGGWGLIPALLAFAVVLTLIFTVAYDGPRATFRLVRGRQSGSARSPGGSSRKKRSAW